jgi:hypothetical protein
MDTDRPDLSILRTVLVLSLTVFPAGALPSAEGTARPKAPFKVLFSNDTTNITTCTSPYHKRDEPFRPEMLEATVDEAVGGDVQLLQPGFGWAPLWKSKVCPDHYRWWTETCRQKASSYATYMLNGGDFVDVFVKRCRQRGVAPFVSLRLNDGHGKEWVDAKPGSDLPVWAVLTQSRFYKEHPEYRIGTGNSWDQTVHNWAIPAVREYKFAFIQEICENYDLDGFELDYMRHNSFFRLNETTSAERVQIMADFVARVRKLLDRTARPGQRRWLCARVPCHLAMHDRLGIDLKRMVAAGLDMVNLSATYFTQQAHDLPTICRMVPQATVYLEGAHCTMTMPGNRPGYDSFLYRRTTAAQFYTTAHMVHRRGGSGMSLFNFVYYREHGIPGVDPSARGPFDEPPFQILARLGDPGWLARQPQCYFLAQNWFATIDGQFTAGQRRTYTLDMAPTEHQTRDGIFRLMVKPDAAAHHWTVSVNGTPLTAIDFVRKPIADPYEAGLGEPKQYACFACPRSILRDGLNQIGVVLVAGQSATIQYLDLTLP